jgi:type II secretory pathway component PulC
MPGIKYLFQSMNVLNGLLTVAVATVAYFTVIPFLNLDIQMSLPAAKETVERSGEKPALPQNYSPVDYAVVSEQNLFHPERKIPPEKKDEKAIPRPEVVLYGIMITGDTSIAFVEDKKAPYSTPGRGKRQMALKKGDTLNGYILREIEANRIVLVKGEDKIVVMLDDNMDRRKSGETQMPQAPSGMPAAGLLPSVAPLAPKPTAPAVSSAPAQNLGISAPAEPRSRRMRVRPYIPPESTAP